MSHIWQMLVTFLNALLDAAQIFWLCAEQASATVFKHNVHLLEGKQFTKSNDLNKNQVIVGKLVTITVEGSTRRVWEKDLPSNWDSISYTLQRVVKRAHSITDVDKQGTGCNIAGGKTKPKSRNSVR